jgi:hypothetical protein
MMNVMNRPIVSEAWNCGTAIRPRENETVFLHPPAVDVECDEARASIA